MSRLRNPFKLRASEKIESDASFLRLYSPIVLDSLIEKDENNKLWNNVMYIHSSPGAGKSSLLRVFEPNVLNALQNNKSATDYKPLYSTLKKLKVIANDEINVLGVTLVCTRNYEVLEELDVSDGQKKRYFFSLLNSRLILATLRAAVNLKQINLPLYEALKQIQFNYDNRDNYFDDLVLPCDGLHLYQWASNIEKRIYTAIDSFLPISDVKPTGINELFALNTLTSDNLTYQGKPIAKTILYMLDDAHKLSLNQRIGLKKEIIEKRGGFTIWISERLEALDSVDNLRSFEGRDYEELNLEKFWGDRPDKFGKILMNVADKRAAISSEDVNSFKEYLDSDLEEEIFRNDLRISIEKSKASISEIASYTDKFHEWIDYADKFNGSMLETSLLYKQIEILINRNVGKPQLAFEFPLTQQELQDKLKSDINVTARLFLSNSVKVPYYFGITDLVKLSTNNIDQFLAFSANLFEEMLSNRLSGNQINVHTNDQERILQAVAEQKWQELSKILPYSRSVIRFLSNLGDACQSDTYKLNAPYAPGVTGFAVKQGKTMFDKSDKWFEDDLYSPLVNVISTCVAFNLLEIKEVNQGEKGKQWSVYYLNRWLCLKFKLPLSYGGWRHKSADELLKWTK